MRSGRVRHIFVILLTAALLASGLAASPSTADEASESLDDRVRLLVAGLPRARAVAVAALPEGPVQPVTAGEVRRVIEALPSTIAALSARAGDEREAIEQLLEFVGEYDFQGHLSSLVVALAEMGDRHIVEKTTGDGYLSWAVHGLLEGELSFTTGFWETFARVLSVVVIVTAAALTCIGSVVLCPAALGIAALGLAAEAAAVLAEMEEHARRSEGQLKFTVTCPGAYGCAVDNVQVHTLQATTMDTFDVRYFPMSDNNLATRIGAYGCYSGTSGVYTPISGSTIDICFTRTVLPHNGVLYQIKPRNEFYDNSPNSQEETDKFRCAASVMVEVVGTWTSGGYASDFTTIAKPVAEDC